MVVVVIIGLLAAIVVPNFMRQRRRRRPDQSREAGHSRHRDGAQSLSARQFKLSEHGGRTRSAGHEPRQDRAPNWKQQLPRMPTRPLEEAVSIPVLRASTASTTCSLTAPTARKAAKASMPTSGTGISNRTSRATSTSAGSRCSSCSSSSRSSASWPVRSCSRSCHVGPDRQIEHEVDRLRGVVDVLHEEALLQSRDFGVLFTQTGYRFYVYDYAKLAWAERPNDRLFARARSHRAAHARALARGPRA